MERRGSWRRLGDEVYVFEQPGAQWGRSNAGLICDGGDALLVDTLMGVSRTRQMLDTAGPILTRRSLLAAVNTGPDAPHHLGNAAVAPSVPIISSSATKEWVLREDDGRLRALAASERRAGSVSTYIRGLFGDCDDPEPQACPATAVFGERLQVLVGGLEVDIRRVCQSGQSFVHVPEASVVFAGALCRTDGFPSPWLESLTERIRACEDILALRPVIVVPGHGLAVGRLAVNDTLDYLRTVLEVCRPILLDGGSVANAVASLRVERFRSWPNQEWLVAHVAALHRDLGLPNPWSRVQVLQALATGGSDEISETPAPSPSSATSGTLG